MNKEKQKPEWFVKRSNNVYGIHFMTSETEFTGVLSQAKMFETEAEAEEFNSKLDDRGQVMNITD